MSETRIALRELDRSCIDELLAWRMEVLDTVFADDGPWDRDALREENRRYYEQSVGIDHVAVVASVDGEDAGCGALCLQKEMPSPDNPSGLCAYLMNVYTRPAFRHQGVGAAVVAWLVDQAQALGAGKIYLEATAAGAPLYADAGFRPMEGMMKLGSADAPDAPEPLGAPGQLGSPEPTGL